MKKNTQNKRVLIIANARSGSRNLMISLADYLDCVCRGEPWNYSIDKINRSYDITQDRLVLKTLADQKPKNMGWDEHYDKLIPKFDLVILLSRKNREEVYESFQHFANQGYGTGWHNDWVKSDELVISDGVKGLVNHQYFCIDKVNESYGIPITWYEDLYSGDYETFKNVVKEWGVDDKEFFKYFNPNNRLRKK